MQLHKFAHLVCTCVRKAHVPSNTSLPREVPLIHTSEVECEAQSREIVRAGARALCQSLQYNVCGLYMDISPLSLALMYYTGVHLCQQASNLSRKSRPFSRLGV